MLPQLNLQVKCHQSRGPHLFCILLIPNIMHTAWNIVYDQNSYVNDLNVKRETSLLKTKQKVGLGFFRKLIKGIHREKSCVEIFIWKYIHSTISYKNWQLLISKNKGVVKWYTYEMVHYVAIRKYVHHFMA